jgi:hypothetical protein
VQWTLQQVREHPLWRGLTDKQRLFFELLEKHELDDVKAAESAFDLRPQSVQVRLNQIRAAQDTGFLYRAMMGMALPSRDEVGAALWKFSQETSDEERKLKALEYLARLMGSRATKSADGKSDEKSPEQSPSNNPDNIPDLSDFKE